MASGAWRILPWLMMSVALAGCARLFTTEGTEAAAKTRVKFILQTIHDHGSGTDTALQTAICRWYNDKIFISEASTQQDASDGFDNWRRQGGIYPDLQTFEVEEKAQEKHDADPDGTWYVTARINGLSRLIRVPSKGSLAWADGINLAPGAVAKKKVVFTEDEIKRKRAEWEESQRMTDQTQAQMQTWRRSRAAPSVQIVPHVGAARPGTTVADEQVQAMRAWHQHYSQRSSAVSLALSQFGMVAHENPPDMPRLLAACRGLRSTSEALLADPQALAAPLATVAGPLTTAYTEIQATAAACLANRADDQAAHLAAARQAMSEAGVALRPYRLAP
jgi:hypothetical protein